MGWVLISSVFFHSTLLSSASSSHECCCSYEVVVWVSRGAYWDTELSRVYRSVDTPPQGKPSVWETVVTSVTWTGMFLKMETGIQKEKHQEEMRGLLISMTKTQLQSDTEPWNAFNSPLQASWLLRNSFISKKVLIGAIPRLILLLKSHPPPLGGLLNRWPPSCPQADLSCTICIQETTGLQRHDFRDVESTSDTFWRRQA